MSDTIKALSDPTRRKILQLLRSGDLSAGEIAEHFDMTKPSLSKHFTVLKNTDLIQGRREGTTIYYTLNVSVLEEALLGLIEIFGIDPLAAKKSTYGKGEDKSTGTSC